MEADEPTAAAAETSRRQDDAETHEVQQLRVMEQPSWTEGRLDDLNNKVDQGIGRLDEERKELRMEVKEGFKDLRGEMNGRFDKVDKGFEKVDGEFKAVRKEMKEGFDKVDKRFEKVDGEFKAVRKEMKEGFDKVDKRFEKVDNEFKAVRTEMKEGFEKVEERFDKIDKRFDAMQRTLIASAATIIAAVFGALIAMPPG
jgi:uncharacterized membrane-anchored protein YhcB (DUF1043 family)